MPSLRLQRVFKEKSKIAALIGRDISIAEMPRQRPTEWCPEEAVSDGSELQEHAGLALAVGASTQHSCSCVRLITGFRTTNTHTREEHAQQ